MFLYIMAPTSRDLIIVSYNCTNRDKLARDMVEIVERVYGGEIVLEET